ncbi:MAG: hypothetical protein IJO96_09455 [Oscillospiraceae bacterium]|nr:hypothetical protein [Oscillospiraceae bacterium]
MSNIKYFLRKDGDGERPAVMWGWGDRVNPDDIVHQIHEFKNGGIDEFYIHPSWMLDVDDYLSDTYMDWIELACKTAESLDMKYSLYDDYAWASGFCAGKVVEGHPEYRMKIMKWYPADVQAGEPAEVWFKGTVLAVQIQYTDKLALRKDITNEVQIEKFDGRDGGIVFWNNNATCTAKMWVFTYMDTDGFGAGGKWSPFTGFQPGFTDTMNPKAVRRFLDINHGTFKKKIGDRFGKTTRRVFTDETPFAPFFFDGQTHPYSLLLEDEFEKEHGYKLRDNYIALTAVRECDEDLKVRHDFFATCTRLFTSAYLKQYSDWCHENGLLLTGHMSGETILYYQSIQMGDFYEALSKFDVPGIDSILSKKYVDSPGFAMTDGKQIASVAKFAGKSKTMCETFSGSGWDMTLEDSKRIINKLMMSGITYIIYMTAFFSTNQGGRDFPLGYPPSHGFQNPLFKYYPTLTDYVAVRSSLLSQTTPLGSTLVLIPQIDAWTHVNTDWRNGSRLHKIWAFCSQALLSGSIDCDIFFESLAKEATVKNGKICLKGYEYGTLIVPSARCSNQATMDIIEEFAKQGGRLVFVEQIPTLAADTGKRYDFAVLCGLTRDDLAVFTGGRGAYQALEKGNVKLINIGLDVDAVRLEYWDDLCKFAKAGSPAEIIEYPDPVDGVIVARRASDGLYCCLVYNDTTETHQVKLSVDSTNKLTLLSGVEFYDCAAENGIVTLEVAPHDMQALLLTAEGVELCGLEKCVKTEKISGTAKEYIIDSGWTFEPNGDNSLPLKIRYLTKSEPCGKLDEKIYEMAKIADMPYGIQEFPAGEDVTFGDGYAAYARFEIEDMPQKLELFTEIVDDAEIWLNGRLLSGYKKVYERGPRDKVTDITGYVNHGTNVLVMLHRMPGYRAPHKMPACVIRGDFCISENDSIVKTHSNIDISRYYTTQGWRYFSGETIYRNSFAVDTDNAKKISIKLNLKEAAEVLVNDVSAGVCCWSPYEADITKLCRKGNNKIEILCTTTAEPSMVLEEIILVSQGVSEYHDEVSPRPVGINAAPVITVIE